MAQDEEESEKCFDVSFGLLSDSFNRTGLLQNAATAEHVPSFLGNGHEVSTRKQTKKLVDGHKSQVKSMARYLGNYCS